MTDILIRGVKSATVAKLKARAKRNGRSLQGEAKLILENAAGNSMPDYLATAEVLRARLGSRNGLFSDSTDLIREDRQR